MFSTPFRAVFYVLAQAFMKLYHMPADWQPTDEHEEFTGADMAARAIDTLDVPDVGTDLPDTRTGVPEQVFNSGADVAAVFAPEAPPAAPTEAAAPQGEPIYTMTDLAGAFTKQDYNVQGWTDQQLIDNGYMTVSYPKPPAPAVVPQPPAPPAPPSAPKSNTAATSTPGGVEGAVPPLDKDGVPWDARIHSSGKKRNADNSWARRKNVPDATYNQVRAELMQRGGAPFAAPQAAHAPLAAPAAPAAPTPPTAAPAPQPPAPPGSNPAAAAAIQQALNAAADPRNDKMQAALSAPMPSTGKELVQWASVHGMGSLFAATAQHVGVPSFGILATPATTQEQIVKAYTFMIEKMTAA